MTKKLTYDDIQDAEFRELVGEAEDVSDIQKTVDEELDTVLGEIGADRNDVKLKMGVYRVIPNSGDLEWCFYFTAAELPILDRLRDEYGGGSFQIRVYKDGKIFTRKTLNVAKPTDRPVTHHKQNSDIEAVLKYVSSGMAQLGEAIKSIQVPQIQPQQNQMEMMTGMMGLMLQMKQLTDSEKPKGMEFKDMMELVKMGTEMGGSGPDPLVKAMEAFGPVVTKAMEIESKKPVLQNPSTRPLQKAPQGPTNPKEVDMLDIKKRMIAAKIGELVSYAEAGKNPELYAEVVMDQVPEDILIGLVCADDAKEQLSVLHPGVTKNWEWFNQMREFIKTELTGDPESDNVSDSVDNLNVKPENPG